MRIGQNPAKFVDTVVKPQEITVAVVSCIPFLSGFYEQSLDVLKACLGSIWENTDRPYDLMVFDNASCQEVRDFLLEASQMEKIQYLVLSAQNIGKMGAWNYIFGASPGKYIAYADSDILFYPGWLSRSLELLETFPNVGMVTARPIRTPEKYSSSTLEWARRQDDHVLQEGEFIDWETYQEHLTSLGLSAEESQHYYRESRDYRLTYDGKSAYVGAAHFQFLACRDVLQRVIPIPSERPLRGDRALDITINDLGYLRLTTVDPYLRHMGNRVDVPILNVPLKTSRRSWPKRLLDFGPLRRVLLFIHNRIFRLYFER
jgi:glycosyltransferase involved in cell wall biosynthesis